MLLTSDFISKLTSPPLSSLSPLPPPVYRNDNPLLRSRVGLAVESMKDHMSDEGYQIFLSLAHQGYILAGHNLPFNNCDVECILAFLKPSVVVVQDKREWDVQPRNFRDPKARFFKVNKLAQREDIFKLTIVKDAHHDPQYHSHSAQEMGCHAWIVYYHPSIVCHLAPYIRPQHVIRTYHTIASATLSDEVLSHTFLPGNSRLGCLLSGARVKWAYPLRYQLIEQHNQLHHTTYLSHPGYHRSGCNTPSFLSTLLNFKVAICTASVFGYALRKIIEATACGCRVITTLPADDILPHIDGNLTRIPQEISTREVSNMVRYLEETYDPEEQRHWSQLTLAHYDYRVMGHKLANDIEEMRRTYANG